MRTCSRTASMPMRSGDLGVAAARRSVVRRERTLIARKAVRSAAASLPARDTDPTSTTPAPMAATSAAAAVPAAAIAAAAAADVAEETEADDGVEAVRPEARASSWHTTSGPKLSACVLSFRMGSTMVRQSANGMSRSIARCRLSRCAGRFGCGK